MILRFTNSCMMEKYYFAETYDVCEHNNLYLDMNRYIIEPTKDLDKQIRKIAKKDIASMVKVYESDRSDLEDFRLYREYYFKEYECGCSAGK